MKITSVKAYPVGMDLKEPLWWGALSINTKGGVVVEVNTDEGITGYGEAGFSVEFFPMVGQIVNDQLAPLLIGEDPLSIGTLWDKMFAATHIWGRRGIQTYALSGVDIALWDILGKVSNQPVYRLLGATKARIRAYFAPSLKPTKQILKEVVEGAEKGFTAIKLRVWQDIDEAIKLVKDTRKELGDKIEIAVDPNMAFDRHAALKVARAYAEYGVSWFEEPIRTHSQTEYLREHAWLAERIDIRLSGGEPLLTRYEYIEPLERHIFDIIQPDCVAVGGISECKRVADMASAWKVTCIPHIACSSGIGIGMSANLHTVLSCSNTPLLEFDAYGGPAWDGLLTQPLKVVDGYVDVPDLPGLGVAFAPGQLQKYRLDNKYAR
jgi:L-alanine-DL-glutamate epimerase-like enolase superfamily enzyme